MITAYISYTNRLWKIMQFISKVNYLNTTGTFLHIFVHSWIYRRMITCNVRKHTRVREWQIRSPPPQCSITLKYPEGICRIIDLRLILNVWINLVNLIFWLYLNRSVIYISEMIAYYKNISKIAFQLKGKSI